MSEELKQCPFCNSTNVEAGMDDDADWFVCCHGCDNSFGMFALMANACKAWNHRPREAALEKKLEGAREALESIGCPTDPNAINELFWESLTKENVAKFYVQDIKRAREALKKIADTGGPGEGESIKIKTPERYLVDRSCDE